MFTLGYNDDSLPDIEELIETDEDRVNRLIYGDKDEEDDISDDDIEDWLK